MSKIVTVPKDLKGKELYAFLVENKSALIKAKKSIVQEGAKVYGGVDFVTKEGKLVAAKDASTTPDIPVDADSVDVKVVCNACYWLDSQKDVLIKDSAKKTLRDRKGMIPHLPDHTHKLAAQIGDVKDVYLEDVPLRKLGINKSGTTQCIVMESTVRKEYDPKVFNLYKKGKVNQHSIGLLYVQIELAINAPEYEKEMDFWNKYYDQIINKEEADEDGYFWVVSEIKVLENSAVLFGSNELTPTLETRSHSGQAAKEEAPTNEPAAEDFDIGVAILTTKFKF